MIYYCVVIIVAAVASGLVSSASMTFGYDGYVLQEGEWLTPNYAFTQINPVPIPVYNVPVVIWKCEFNLLYLIILYVVYVGLFWAFTGGYYAFNAVKRRIYAGQPQRTLPDASVLGEAAATDDEDQT